MAGRGRKWLQRVGHAVLPAIVPRPAAPRRKPPKTKAGRVAQNIGHAVLPGVVKKPAAPRKKKTEFKKRKEAAERAEKRSRDPYRRAWQQAGLTRKRSFQRNRDFFDQLPGMEFTEDDEKEQLWRSYVQYMVAPGRYRRDDIRNPWWHQSGINPYRDFNWGDWRNAMGFSKGRKS